MELAGGGNMSYKIAVASSDELIIDESFGSAKVFHIFEVTEKGYSKIETRQAIERDNYVEKNQGQGEGCNAEKNCGNGGCHNGQGGGCSGNGQVSWKVELVSDCRCIVCKKIGFNVQKQLERRAITAFDVNCSVEEALTKISSYFQKVDGHQSLRGISK